MKIRVAVAEDETASRRQIGEFLDRFATEKRLELQVTFFTNGDGLTAPYKPEYDIILLDIEMPLVNGMEAARIIRDQDPEVIIIFLTNLAQYAIQGYAVQAFDYILKPVTWFSFSSFLDRAVTKVSRRSRQYIAVTTKEGTQKLAIQDIYYIEVRSHTLLYHTREKTVCATGRMRDVQEQLTPFHFSRCNNSFLVNLAYVDAIQDNDVLLVDQRLPISRPRKKEFSSDLIAYISAG